jgi:hypothetical protein
MIEFRCRCGFRTPARAELDGHQARCPRCGQTGRIGQTPLAAFDKPPPVPRVSPGPSPLRLRITTAAGKIARVLSRPIGSGQHRAEAAGDRPEPADGRVPCAVCAEMIQRAARKCPFCGAPTSSWVRFGNSLDRFGKASSSLGCGLLFLGLLGLGLVALAALVFGLGCL